MSLAVPDALHPSDAPPPADSLHPVDALDSAAASSSSLRARRRLFALLALGGPVGFVGALPYLLPLLRQSLEVARAAGKSVPELPIVVLAQMAQFSLLVALAAWVGVRLSARTGLDAPYLRALATPAGDRPSRNETAEGKSKASFLAELPRALLVGAIFSAAVLAFNHLAGPYLPDQLRASNQVPGAAEPLWTALLRGASSAFYGGIAEELLLRWGVLSALAALFSLFAFFRARRTLLFWTANLSSAILFGLGHLPAVHAIGAPMTLSTVGFIVTANALAGIACGWLFARRGLESAMVAHGFGDLCLHALPLLFA